MKIIYVRHGETDWNSLSLIQGRTDIPLNENGLKQAEATRDLLKDIHIDIIYSSPLSRAMKTAEIINESHHCQIIKDERLLEECYGKLEGTPRDKGNAAYQEHRVLFATRYPGGESYFDVAHRIYGFLDEMKQKHAGKSILIVAHGGISRLFESYFRDLGNEEFVNHQMDNCSYRVYEI